MIFVSSYALVYLWDTSTLRVVYFIIYYDVHPTISQEKTSTRFTV